MFVSKYVLLKCGAQDKQRGNKFRIGLTGQSVPAPVRRSPFSKEEDRREESSRSKSTCSTTKEPIKCNRGKKKKFKRTLPH